MLPVQTWPLALHWTFGVSPGHFYFLFLKNFEIFVLALACAIFEHTQVLSILFFEPNMGELLPTKVGSSKFLMVGAIGYLVGFLAWFFWLLLVVSAWLYYLLGYGYPNYMSGIFFQNWFYNLIFRGLLSLSFALGSFGCFGLKQKYGSNLAFACGILYLAIFAVLTSSLIIPVSHLSLRLWFIYYNPVPLLNIGLLVWAATMLTIRKSLPNPRKAFWIGLIFLLISALTLTWFISAILYWGFEFWLLLFGWLYAIDAMATGRFLFQIKKA